MNTPENSPADTLPLRELLLHILDYTDGGVLTELWPDHTITLDDIAGRILTRHATELAEVQRQDAALRGLEGLTDLSIYGLELANMIIPEDPT